MASNFGKRCADCEKDDWCIYTLRPGSIGQRVVWVSQQTAAADYEVIEGIDQLDVKDGLGRQLICRRIRRFAAAQQATGKNFDWSIAKIRHQMGTHRQRLVC